MKKFISLFSLFLTLTFVLGSCSKDDSPAPGNERTSFGMVFNVNSLEAKHSVSPPPQSRNLVDVLTSANKDKVSYIKSAEMQNSDSYVRIDGLNAGESLDKVVINLLENQTVAATVDLGKFTANEDGSAIKESGNTCLNFLNTVVNNLVSKKSITLQVVINGGDKNVSNVIVTVHTTARYNW